ncbi:lysophospholipase [Streptomyces sp. RS2]|uniref:alpha/beta hydrolase n=1 Tax=Streptomyces sp. RS2 TaxID=1451205 RepID=UPI0021F8244E|nr:lysophospholipase [Streptomyces sp. RS2]MCW1099167.1 lysophospholipase [Streptomyces sp. RS2]
MTEYTDHHTPQGLRTRGTVVVVPGRGESHATYNRFGRRLAADAYRVRVVNAPVLDPGDTDGSLARFGRQLAAAVEGTAAEDGVVHPVVLVGADSGAVAVAALLGSAGPAAAGQPDAVVLAGLPGRAAAGAGGWESELDIRTSCPTHRAVLTDDPGVRRGSLDAPVPAALLTAAHDAEITVPALLLAGDADPLADLDALERTTKSLPHARLSVVLGGHHDVLNDLTHRSVAAEVVTFLEALRDGLRPAVTVRAGSW